jgi:ubiquinone/menaquinone biosynthesis C-methylase UbiE
MPDRVERAQQILPPTVQIQQGEASVLPYANDSFDIVCQLTVFSSIIEESMRKTIALEMLRVLKPGGLIVWYDFWHTSGTDPNIRGVQLEEVKTLFPNCHYDIRRTTLAAHWRKRLIPRFWCLAHLLEKLPLCTHWLVGIQKNFESSNIKNKTDNF